MPVNKSLFNQPTTVPDAIGLDLEQKAYGPIYGSQFADAAKSARANELGHQLGLPADIVESSMPDMMAEDRVRKRLDQIRFNRTYAQIMAGNARFARGAMDDDALPQVATAIDQHVQHLSADPSLMNVPVIGPVVGQLPLFKYLGGQFAAGTLNFLRSSSILAGAARDLAPQGMPSLLTMPGPLQAIGLVGKALTAAGPGLRKAEQDVTPDQTDNWFANAVGSGVYSAPTTIGALGLAAAGAPEIGAALAASQAGSQSYESGRDAGLTPGQAARYGLTDAAIEAATEYGPEKLFAGLHGGNLAKQALKFLGAEVGGEMAATAGQSFDQWYWVDRQKGTTFKQYLSSLPDQEAQTVVAILATTGATGPVAHVIGKAVQQRYDTMAAQHADQVMEAAAGSPTRTANPTDFHMALNQVLQDTPAENLYVPAEKVAELFKPAKEGEAAPAIEDDPFWSKYAGDVQDGAALGHDVVVPLADAATHLAGTPQWEQLKDFVRTSPTGSSISEAREKLKPEDLDALAGKIGDMVEQAVPRAQAAQALQIARQTAQGFGFDPEKTDAVNHVIASAMFTRYQGENARRAAAGEKPLTMAEFAQQWLPDVKQQVQAEYEKAAGADTLEQGSEAFRKWFGNSKVVDEKGRPLVVYHGTGAQFDAFNPNVAPTNYEADRGVFHFTNQRGTAEAYSQNSGPFGEVANENPRVIEALVSLQNPLMIDNSDSPIEDWDTYGDQYREEAERKGKDGIIIQTEDGKEKLVIAFRPEQIKSVDNRGTYDPNDPSIYAQGTGGDNAAAGSVRDRGRLPGSSELLAAASGSELGDDQPLAGEPQSLTVPGVGKVAVKPYPPARSAARGYMAASGKVYQPALSYAKLDPERATRLASAFEEMEHKPNDPEVRAAYEAMISETLEQFDAILQTGLQIEFIHEDQEDPYAASPRLAILDVQNNNHLWVFPTTGGFGQGEVNDSPMLQPTSYVIDGHSLLANDVFRIVHYYFGHIKDGHGFRAEGEENAWQSHAAMYSPLARRAMTTETRGQNSWLNFGPHGSTNRTASTEETVFAPQKVGLMPEWASEEGMLAGENSGKELSDVYPTQEDRGRTSLSQLNDGSRDEGAGRYEHEGLVDPQELTTPPVDQEGNVQLHHWSVEPELTQTDPDKWGRSGRFLPQEERMRIGVAPPRTYFGLAFGEPGGYGGEGLQRGTHPVTGAPVYHYTGQVKLDSLYDMAGDPDGIKQWARDNVQKGRDGYKWNGTTMDGASLYEHLIQQRGYSGYWIKNDQTGLVAAVFDAVPVAPRVATQTLNQSLDPVGFERVAPFLTAEEQEHMRSDSKAKLLNIIDTLPKAEEMAAVAHAGRAKKGWYARSAQAIVDVFGLQDAPRFAALLAALSPQVSVETNFYNALKVWTGWNNAGRPTDRVAIVQIMADNVLGEKGERSILGAWKNNAFAALSDADPATLKLSGPKVNSFFANLVGVTDEVTNDTWMARYAGLENVGLSGRQGKHPLYNALSAVTREAARILTEKTGEAWEPMEVQETVWSFAKTLYEMRDLAGEDRTMNELLDAGGITHQDIAATPDFAVLFTDNIFRRILEEGGYGRQVADLESSGRAVHVNGAEGTVTSGEGSGFAPDAYQSHLAAAANRLEAIRDKRRANAEERRRDLRQYALTLNQDVTPSEEVFYSNATRAVENAKQDKASPEQWAALLTPGRTPGIKAEEIEWTGVLDWLKMQKGQVFKDALLQVLRDRGIVVREEVLGNEDWTYQDLGYEINLDDEDNQWVLSRDGEEVERFRTHDQAERYARTETFEEANKGKFQHWSSDPNNPTYRELLITLPLGQGSNPERAPSTHWDHEAVVAHVRFMEKTDAEGKRVLFIEEVQSDWHQKGRDQGYEAENRDAARKAAVQRRDAAYARLQRAEVGIIEKAPEVLEKWREVAMPEGATFNEYGKARNAEYATIVKDIETWRRDVQEVSDGAPPEDLDQFQNNLADRIYRFVMSAAFNPLMREEMGEFNNARLEMNEAAQGVHDVDNSGIPDAPFKSSWPALVMKRTIRWAVDHGADKIAWTTGKEQAERYNLSAATGPLRITQEGDRFLVKLTSAAAFQLVDNNMATTARREDTAVLMTADQLKEAFGSDIANRIAEKAAEVEAARPENERLLEQARKDATKAHEAALDEQRKAYEDNVAGRGVDHAHLAELQAEASKQERIVRSLEKADEFVIEGEDLNVGGEGMKAFYDRNLVNITNDIIKKYGAKVGPVDVISAQHSTLLQRAQDLEQRIANSPHLEGTAMGRGNHEQLDFTKQKISELPSPTHLGFEITPQLRDAAAGGFPLFQGKRGNIDIYPGENGLMRSALIRAFEAANFSTAIHELGHFFLEDLKRRALSSGATAREINDWQTFKQWAESLGHPVDDSAPIPVPAHEYFARGFERFAWEGKAPSLGLRAIFTRLREFMLSLYRSATAFNAPITPEIREVMGRMLVSQQEIDQQRAEMKLVNDKIKGLLSDTEQRAYDDLAEESRQDARDKLYERVLSSLRQQKRSEASAQKNNIRSEVEADVAGQPIYRALKLMRVGQQGPDGSFSKVKLDRQWLTDTYGPEIEGQLPPSVPPIVSDKDTMDADHIAELSGFASGDELVKTLLAHEQQRQALREEGDKRSPRQKEIDDQVEQRAREEIGDPYAHLEEEARDAVASDKQAELMSLEVRALARKTGQKPTPWRMAKEWAANRIAIQTAREAISGRAIQMYARAIAKAGGEYEEQLIKGDFEEAFRAKQRQLLNMALMSEAKKAANEVDAAVRRMQKIAKRDTIPSVDQDYLEQAHALLGDVDLKSNNAQADRAASFADWHARQVELGVTPVVPPGYRELLGKTHWSKLTVPDLLELDKTVGQIIELGRLKKTLIDGQRQRDFDEGIAEMVGSAEVRKSRKAAKTLGERTLPERIRSKLRSADAAMLKIEQIAKWLDGEDPLGPWTRLLFQPMRNAENRENDLLRSYVSEINAIIRDLPSQLVRRWQDRVDVPELVNDRVPAMSKDQVIMAAMNWGNEGNKQRLLDGYGWEEASVKQVFDRLMTKEDWDFVQNIWNVVDKLWPEVAALERRVNGIAPEKVEAVPVSTPHGVYRGGYFPVIYDASMSSRAMIDEENKIAPEGGFMQVTTRASATKQRLEAVKDRPLLLSMSVITRHLGEVIHDVTNREAVMNAKKILGDKRIGDAVREHLGPEYLKAMGAWLENVARPGTMYSKANPWTVAVGRYLNKSVAMVGLGFRVSTTVMQLLGIPVAIGEVGEANVVNAMRTVIAHPIQSWNEMQARSAYMRARADTLDATLEEMVHAHHAGKLAAIGPRGIQKYALRGIAYMDMVVSTTIWTAGFNKALKQGLNEDEASDYADQAVRTTQGGGGQTDRSGIMFEHPMVRSFYAFFSYMNALFNMQRDAFRKAGEGDYLEAARRAWWVMIVPAMLQAAIFGQGPTPGDDGEIDVSDWVKYLLLQIAVGNVGSIPGIGTLASAAVNAYTYRSSAYNAMGEGLMREVNDVKHVAKGDKDVDGSTVKAALNTLGLVTAQPLGQVGATAGGLYDYAEGNAQPESASDWYNLLTRGYIPQAH